MEKSQLKGAQFWNRVFSNSYNPEKQSLDDYKKKQQQVDVLTEQLLEQMTVSSEALKVPFTI